MEMKSTSGSNILRSNTCQYGLLDALLHAKKLFINCITDPSEPTKIGMEGCIRFLEDLKLDASSRTVLLIAWKCKAATQCEFTKEEFAQGLVAMG